MNVTNFYSVSKNIYWIILCISSMLLFSCKQNTNAINIVKKSLESHGGIEKWNAVEELSYKKTTILYDSLGDIEQKLVQTHFNSFKPEFSAVMEWTDDTIHKKVVLGNEENKVLVFYNGQKQNNTTSVNAYYKNIVAANYVLWQPFKLLDKEVSLSYEGEEYWEDGKRALVMKATYPEKAKTTKNTWWYYFDSQTYRLLGNMVHHGNTYSLIKNIKYENQTGLFLNAERKSYRVDSLRNIKFLRAHYFYEILKIKKVVVDFYRL